MNSLLRQCGFRSADEVRATMRRVARAHLMKRLLLALEETAPHAITNWRREVGLYATMEVTEADRDEASAAIDRVRAVLAVARTEVAQ